MRNLKLFVISTVLFFAGISSAQAVIVIDETVPHVSQIKNCRIHWTSVLTGKESESNALPLKLAEKVVSDFDASAPNLSKADKHKIVCAPINKTE